MPNVETPTSVPIAERLNVTDRLSTAARKSPNAIAVVCPAKWSPTHRPERRGDSGAEYASTTFAELDIDATRITLGLASWGVPKGTRLALLVRPGIDFVALVFGLLRAGMVIVLIDPGLGRKNLIRCLAEAEPEGFVAISLAHAVRLCLRQKFPLARWNVTVGKRWFWGGLTLDGLRARGATQVGWAPPTIETDLPSVGGTHSTRPDDPAAIIFTSGSTGPPKGVLYTQRMFDTQVAEIQAAYNIAPGGVDLACFPLFALFNSAMGVTTVLPEMDFSRPAAADPKKLLAAANDWQVTQAFASPAVWRVLGDYCTKTGSRIPSLKQVFSCGAPVPAEVLRTTLGYIADGAKMHTPYGATECLPVATIEAAEVLKETAARTNAGAGVCVGRKFRSVDWRVIRITDDPIATIDESEVLPNGEIGELIVRGPQVSPRYVTRVECNGAAKISSTRAGRSPAPTTRDGGEDAPARCVEHPCSEVWHRTGDVGYFDDQQRFWYCGRKSQRVQTRNGALFTEKIEAVFNSLPGIRRSALVGVGPVDNKAPVVIIEPEDRSIVRPSINNRRRQEELACGWHDIEPRLERLWYAEQGFVPLASILFHPGLPVDVRHNSKINREQLAAWATIQLAKSPPLSPHP